MFFACNFFICLFFVLQSLCRSENGKKGSYDNMFETFLFNAEDYLVKIRSEHFFSLKLKTTSIVELSGQFSFRLPFSALI